MLRVVMLGRCGAFPVAGEATTGFLLQTTTETMLVDCGSGILERMQRFVPLESLDAVIISHYHHDHVADLGVLQYGAMITQKQGYRTNPLVTYLPTEDQPAFSRYQFEPSCTRVGISADSIIETDSLTIRFLPTRHPVPCLAMRFESEGHSVSFSGDSAYIPELAPFVAGSDIFVCETNFFADEDGSITQHLTSREAGHISQEAGVKQLVMTHLPARGDLDRLRREVMDEYHGDVHLARTGLILEA